MLSNQIDNRQKAVLETIIEQFVMTAQPVSSATVARKSGLRLSSATIRNVMVELEDGGLLEQPHVSSGRIPTDKGYRVYVDKMMKIRGLTKREKQVITDHLRDACRDVDEILAMSCSILSTIWGQLAIALGPGLTGGILKRIDFIPVGEDRVMVVISVASGVIRTVFIEVDKTVAPAALERARKAINDRLTGLPLATAWNALGDEPERLSVGDPVVRQVLVRLVRSIAAHSLDGDLHLDGTYRVLDQPEFESRDLVTSLLSVVETRERLARELSLFRYQPKPRVMIGRENSLSEFTHLSIVASGVSFGQVRGAIGIIGPIRMQYAKLIPAVQYVAQSIGEILCVS